MSDGGRMLRVDWHGRVCTSTVPNLDTTLETTLGQTAPPKSGHPSRMPPESGGIPGRDHFREVPSALMLSAG